MSAPRVVRLEASQLDEAAHVLTRAFFEDPLQRYAMPDDGERARRSLLHFRPVLRYGLLFGEVYTTASAVRGAAVWLPPGGWRMTADRIARSGLDRLPEAIGLDTIERFSAVMHYLEPLHERDAPELHWYAMTVGVDPANQGQGIGSALLEIALARADAEGLSCYLETAQPRNIGFYEKHGFAVVTDGTEPVSGLRLWTFRRAPRPPAPRSA